MGPPAEPTVGQKAAGGPGTSGGNEDGGAANGQTGGFEDVADAIAAQEYQVMRLRTAGEYGAAANNILFFEGTILNIVLPSIFFTQTIIENLNTIVRF